MKPRRAQSAGARLRYELLPPEPSRFWIRHAPKSWPGPDVWWTDLARAEPARQSLRAGASLRAVEEDFHDVVYLPPVDAKATRLRREVLERAGAVGVPVVVQLLPGEEIPAGPATVVVDLTARLLERRLDDLAAPPGSWAVWPLIAGLTDAIEHCGAALERLRQSGVVGVVPLALSLTPTDRRQLAEFGDASSYSRIFHQDAGPDATGIAREAARLGLDVFPARPPLALGRRAPNRSLAAHFALLAELWLGCGRPEGRAEVFFRIARRLDEEPVPVAEAVRRGGIRSVDWLDDDGLQEISEIVETGSSRLLRQLEDDFLHRAGEGT